MAPEKRKREPDAQAKLDRLLRWLRQLRKGDAHGYNTIRRIARVFGTTTGVIRGALVADNLVLNAKREFYLMEDTDDGPDKATKVSVAYVAAHFNIDVIQINYRKQQDAWRHSKKSA
jgi:hypothetical protein